jgi:ATP-dependent RNA helicase DDX27
MDDFVRTIDSDAEIGSEDAFPQEKRKIAGKQRLDKATGLNPEFVFDLTGDTYQDVLNEHAALEDIVKSGSKPVCRLFHCVP